MDIHGTKWSPGTRAPERGLPRGTMVREGWTLYKECLCHPKVTSTTVFRGSRQHRQEKTSTREDICRTTALQKAGQGGLNGLGINLDLQKGSNYATAGQFLGTPVSVINATGVGKDGAGNYSQAAPNSNGTKPTTSNPSLLGAAATALFGAQKAVLDKVKSFLPSSDQAPSGDTPSAGQYFPPPQPLSDTTPFTASVDENSSPADIQASLSQLNSSWASDNSYVNSQAPDPSAISDRLSAATSEQERAAIQADADSSYNTIQGIQSTVDAKYQSEFSRLSNLLNTAQTKTSGSDSTQSTPDESPTTPSPESDAVPPPNEDI